MSRLRWIVVLPIVAGLALAEEPVTTLRSAVNGVSLQLAPSPVARGGILAVFGEGLADGHTVPDEMPLPLSIGDPAVEVLVNGVAAPLFFVSPTQVNAQVPWEIEAGPAEVVLRRDGVASASMPVIVTDVSLNLIRHEGSSAPIAESVPRPAAAPSASSVTLDLGQPGTSLSASGEILDPAEEVTPGATIALFAAGVGATEPAMATGSPGAEGESYSLLAPQRAYLGGMPVVDPIVEVSTELVGIFKLTFTVPENAWPTEGFRWNSGGQGASAVLGPVGPPHARYMSLPEGIESVSRIDMTDLNPHFVAVSGQINDEEGCYPSAHLLDFRREATTVISDCILPSYPNAPNPQQAYRPFEAAVNSPALAALVVPPDEDIGDGITNRLLLIDGATGSTETVILDRWVDRLQPDTQGRPNLRLEHPGGTGARDVVDIRGDPVGETSAVVPLPSPLEVDGLSRSVAQTGVNLQGGYRVRILGPESPEEIASSKVILFDRSASVVGEAALPDGWAPIAPPRRINPQGVPVGGQSVAPAASGFPGDTSVYVVIRRTDGSQDGVLAVRIELPGDPEADPPGSPALTVDAIPFPDGTFAASCTLQVRWQRIPLTRTLVIAAADTAHTENASPVNGQICTSDRLVLFQADSTAMEVIGLPDDAARLDVATKGAVGGYLYFGDGARQVPLRVPRRLHVFDGGDKSFSEIELPEGVGITINNLVQQMPANGRLVALATGGPLRTNNRTGAQRPQVAGNRGLLVIDLPQGSVTHLPLPDGYQRIIPGTGQMVNAQKRGFGVLPLVGRAVAAVRLPNAGPGAPGGSRIMTWDLETGEATEIAMPEGGFAVVRPVVQGQGGGGQGQGLGAWDFSPKTASFAFGVYDEGGNIMSIGVVGP